MRRSHSRLERAWVTVFAVVVVYCVFFVLSEANLVRNRFTDSWWHIAVADEYAKTRAFAKDPFLENAPEFAPFGLTDFVNARASRITGHAASELFPVLVALNVGIFMCATFMAGLMLKTLALIRTLAGTGKDSEDSEEAEGKACV